MINAVLFDLDGVLADSEPMYKEIGHALLAEHGAEIDLAQPRFMGLGFHGFFELAIKEAGIRADPDELSQLLFATFLSRLGELRPVPGAREALREIQERYATAVVSSSPRLIVDPILAQLKMAFPATVCEREAGKLKPAPEPFLHAAQLLGVPAAACAVVEDATPGLVAGNAAGMRTIGLRTPLNTPASVAAARRLINSMAELPAALEELNKRS